MVTNPAQAATRAAEQAAVAEAERTLQELQAQLGEPRGVLRCHTAADANTDLTSAQRTSRSSTRA